MAADQIYKGAVVNGPLFGQNLQWSVPYYEVAVYPPTDMRRVAEEGPVEPLVVTFVTYEYYEPLGCWRLREA